MFAYVFLTSIKNWHGTHHDFFDEGLFNCVGIKKCEKKILFLCLFFKLEKCKKKKIKNQKLADELDQAMSRFIS